MISILILGTVAIGLLMTWSSRIRPPANKNSGFVNKDLLLLSIQILQKVRGEEFTDVIDNSLNQYSVADLARDLSNDNARKVFWINIYNAYFQIFATRNKIPRKNIFKYRGIRFADIELTLDEIEHGILRQFRWKYGLGYLPQFITSKHLKNLSVEEIDFRIHFALNCGAKSCPPIAYYSYDNLFTQLEQATCSFLESETQFDDENKIAYLNKIMCWFHGDFSGREGIRTIIKIYLSRDITDYRIRYKSYDWNEHLNNFGESPL